LPPGRRRSPVRIKPTQRLAKPCLETLESRTLLAVSATISPSEVIAAVRSTQPLTALAASLPDSVDVAKSVVLPTDSEISIVQIGLHPGSNPMATIKRLQALPFVTWAAPNYVYNSAVLGTAPEYIPNDPLFAPQQHHAVVHNDWSWDITEGDPRITVAITDEGFDLAHVDLYENVWINQSEIPASRIENLTDLDGNGIITIHELNNPVNQGPFKITDQNGNGRIDALDLLAPMGLVGSESDAGTGGWANGWDDNGDQYVDDLAGWDTSSGDNNPSPADGSGHGTHVAGIVAARTNNGIGTAGGAGNVTFMPIRFYGSGGWTSSKIYSAYAYAADHGARIVSTSYNIDGFVGDPTFEAALNYLYAKGVLHFNSAGNNNLANPTRGRFDQSLYVVSTNNQDQKSSFSNYGSAMDIAAPGENIISTLPENRYGSMSGTSMATPVAAATAAIIWSIHPDWNRDQVAAQLIASADPIDAANPNYVGSLGAGRVNTYRAILEPAFSPVLGDVIGLPANGGTATGRIRGFELEIANVLDPTSVMNPASWEMRNAGRDGRFDTLDDSMVPLQLLTNYLIGTNRLAFQLGSTLGPGRYQFRALSGGLTDPFGQLLDGNADGGGGDTYVRSFTVSIAGNIVIRPVFTPSRPNRASATDSTVESGFRLHRLGRTATMDDSPVAQSFDTRPTRLSRLSRLTNTNTRGDSISPALSLSSEIVCNR
jgi:subtilisin family serine protease